MHEAPAAEAWRQTIVMTGGTSGFGRLALSHLQGPNRRIVAGARTVTAGEATLLPLDLSRLDSVRRFAGRVLREIDAPIDTLILMPGFTAPTLRHVAPTATNRPSRPTIWATICCCAS